jgi:hypothetical protein
MAVSPSPEHPDRLEPPALSDEAWWFSTAYLKLLTHPSSAVALSFKIAVQWAFYVGPLLSPPLLALLWGAGNRWSLFAIASFGLTLLAVLTTSGAWPHYLAPVAPLAFVLAVQGSRYLSLWRCRGRRIGRYWVPALGLAWPLQLILLAVIFPLMMKGLRWGEPRAELQARLERLDGDHLVLVRYGPQHTWYQEWVYNKADIDNAKVVWARELSPDSNRRLLAYFKGRRVWLVEPHRDPPSLVPYPE